MLTQWVVGSGIVQIWLETEWTALETSNRRNFCELGVILGFQRYAESDAEIRL
jgi:hypothetical protein